GSAVVLRMNSMDLLRAGYGQSTRRTLRPCRHYNEDFRDIGIYVRTRSLVTTRRGKNVSPGRSVPGIGDQGFSRAEQDHQQDTDDAQDRKYRLVQDHLDHGTPEPGHVALDPGAERLLAGLMDVVPELPKPGEAQVLVGHPARPVIDHEDE